MGREREREFRKTGNIKNHLCDIKVTKIYGKISIEEWNTVLESKSSWNNGQLLRFYR